MMNNANQISHHTQLYGYIGVDAGSSSFCATLNKTFKANNRDAMAIPMNIREDDFYFTISNMKNSHVNGAFISNEFTLDVVELLDGSSDLVKKSGMCDVILREEKRVVGDIYSIKVLANYLKENCVKKVALFGVDARSKAFVLLAKDMFDISYFSDNIEGLLSFTKELEVVDADINRASSTMSVDMSSYDVVVDFSNEESLTMLKKLAPLNIDMKHKKEFSALKSRATELQNRYISFDDMLSKITLGAYNFLSDSKHLEHDKSEMRF